MYKEGCGRLRMLSIRNGMSHSQKMVREYKIGCTHD
jgi:hypothetical protein